MEEPDRPAASPCLLAYSGSKPSSTTREYFRGGSRMSERVLPPSKTQLILSRSSSRCVGDLRVGRENSSLRLRYEIAKV